MLDVQSPLGALARFEGNGVVLSEATDFTLTQIAGEEKILKKALGKLPTKIGQVVEVSGRSLLRVGARQFWILGEAPAQSEGMYITPLSSGRTRIQLEGPNARKVLAACALIDFSPAKFKPTQFVLTGIHHTPVTIQFIDGNTFHIFALRTFAQNVWEWLCDIAEGLDYA
jgi:heterotetrameric sarcosine oxidase gamma subunit